MTKKSPIHNSRKAGVEKMRPKFYKVFLTVLAIRFCFTFASVRPGDWARVQWAETLAALALGALLWGGIVYGIYPYTFGRSRK